MSMIGLVCVQRLFHEHGSASIWSEGFFMSMIVQVFGQRLFHEHDSASIWSEAFS